MLRIAVNLFLGILTIASGASADLIDTFTIDTSPLVGHPAGPFSLELQLNDGSGIGDGNNTAILSAFSFGGGMPTGVPFLFGGVSGDMGSTITMSDSSFFNQFMQTFTPGSEISFQLDLTTNLDTGGVPDEFSVSILDSSGVEIPTLNVANALVVIDIDSSTPSIATFQTDSSQSPNAGGPPISIPAPTFAPVATSTPEPPSFSLLSLALGTIMVFCRRKRGSAGKRIN